MAHELTRWTCRHCGLVLGVVKRSPDRIRRLVVLAAPQPAELADEQLAPMVKMARVVVHGSALVHCTCGEQRTWHPGQHALDAMLKRRERNKEAQSG